MIRMTTCPNKTFQLSKKKIESSVDKLLQDNVDIICFQKTSSVKTDNLSTVEKLSRSLGMTYTFSNTTTSADSSLGDGNKKKKTTFAILNGKNTWMLNSGSLPLTEDQKDERNAQFALIRHEGNSILIINAYFSPFEEEAKIQLKNMLGLNMLKERYGAVIINSNLDKSLSVKATNKVFDQESFTVHSALNGDRTINLLSTKENPPAALKLHQPEKATIIQFDLITSTKNVLKKRYSRLSFRERWLGSRDGDRAFAF